MPGYSVIVEHNGQRVYHWRPTLNKAVAFAEKTRAESNGVNGTPDLGDDLIGQDLIDRIMAGLARMSTDLCAVEPARVGPPFERANGEGGGEERKHLPSTFASLPWWETLKREVGIGTIKDFDKAARSLKGFLILAREALQQE